MRRIYLTAAILIAAVVVFIAVSGPPPAKPNPPGTFSFAVLGDAPYYGHEELKFEIVLDHIEAHDLASVIHVGDIFWRPCSDAMYAKFRRRFDELRHPLIYTPGDNEWADCWEPRVGGYVPLDRLAHLRRTFFNTPSRSLGRRAIPLTFQPNFPENARWRTDDVTFATMHMVGSWNGFEPFPGRTAADDAASHARTAAAVAWLRETFADAGRSRSRAVVLAFHFGLGIDNADYRAKYTPLLAALEDECARFGKPVLVVQGDDHEYIVDRPLPNAPNVTRMQVPGSPLVGWVRVTVSKDANQPWTFEQYVVPKWKYW